LTPGFRSVSSAAGALDTSAEQSGKCDGSKAIDGRQSVRFWTLLLCTGVLTTRAAADIAVFRPDNGARSAEARATTDRVERFFTFGGIATSPCAEADIGNLSPARVPVLVLAAGSMSAAGSAAVERYVGAGGKILLFSGVDVPALARLIGV